MLVFLFLNPDSCRRNHTNSKETQRGKIQKKYVHYTISQIIKSIGERVFSFLVSLHFRPDYCKVNSDDNGSMSVTGTCLLP